MAGGGIAAVVIMLLALVASAGAGMLVLQKPTQTPSPPTQNTEHTGGGSNAQTQGVSDSEVGLDPQAQPAPPPPGRVPPKPDWARMVIDDRVREAYMTNQAVAKKANSAGTQFDFVLYGDSITQRIPSSTWTKFFGKIRSTPMGIGGTTIEELAWRLMAGGELFSKAPKTVAVLIGINNLKHGRKSLPADRLEYLLKWMRASMPSSKIILLALMPNSSVNVASSNATYKSIAQKVGAQFLDCNAGLNANNKAHFGDGTHPGPEGYSIFLGCLARNLR